MLMGCNEDVCRLYTIFGLSHRIGAQLFREEKKTPPKKKKKYGEYFNLLTKIGSNKSYKNINLECQENPV